MTARTKLNPSKFPVGYPSQRDEAVLNAGGIRVESAVWDFAVDGGAVGTITLGRSLPAGAVVTRIVYDELTATTGTTDMVLMAGATALSATMNFNAGTDTGTATQPLDSSASAIKVAAASELAIAIATDAATAGKIRFFVEYMLQTDTKV